jgi:hypothetical protein
VKLLTATLNENMEQSLETIMTKGRQTVTFEISIMIQPSHTLRDTKVCFYSSTQACLAYLFQTTSIIIFPDLIRIYFLSMLNSNKKCYRKKLIAHMVVFKRPGKTLYDEPCDQFPANNNNPTAHP